MPMNLRIIFFGTPDFAVASLRAIHESGRKVVAVVTSADKKAGRGQKMHASSVKKYAVDNNLPILQPDNLKSPQFIERLASLKADLQIVVAFRMLPEVVWNMPAMGTFNLHASLLPKYRGAAPINWAIINGEKESGLTTFFLKHQIDTGDVLLQKKVAIADDETAGSLHDKLMVQGGELVLESLALIEKGTFQLKEQSTLLEEQAIPNAPKIFKENCQINWEQNAQTVDCFIRGLSPYPAAWTRIVNRNNQQSYLLKILSVNILDEKQKAGAGKIEVENSLLKISCNDYLMKINELQLEGKKRMSAKELLNGFTFKDYKIDQYN